MLTLEPTAICFQKSDIRQLCRKYAATTLPLRRLYDRLHSLYEDRLFYAFGVPTQVVIAADTTELPVIPMGVFRSVERKWRLQAVFDVVQVQCPMTGADQRRHSFLASLGVEYVPVPAELNTTTYLHAPDFKRRARRAIFVPMTVPFVPFPKPVGLIA